MMAVAIEIEPTFNKLGAPQVLFEGVYSMAENQPVYDVHPDDGRFLMIKREEAPTVDQINVVLNWFEELKRLAPRGD